MNISKYNDLLFDFKNNKIKKKIIKYNIKELCNYLNNYYNPEIFFD